VIACHGERMPMVELEPPLLRAAPPLLVHEAAPRAVASVHRAAHRRRDVSRSAGRLGSILLDPWSFRPAEAPSFEPLERRTHGMLDDRREVAVGNPSG
jgi:hypothetical protein